MLKNASVAFVGWPVSVRCVFEGEDVVAFDYVFEVADAWLPVARRVTIRTGFSTCGFVFEPDVRYLIVDDGTGTPTVSRCSETGPENSVTAVLSLLGKPVRRYRRRHAPRSGVTVMPACLMALAR